MPSATSLTTRTLGRKNCAVTSFRAPRRLSVPLVLAFLIAFALVLVPSSPASAVVTQGISGTVTGPGGTPLSGIDVGFFQLFPDGNWGYSSSAVTDATGHYAKDLTVGVWRVGFAGGSEDYVIEYYDDVADVNHAANVWVTESQVTANIDAQLAPHVPGHITGHIDGSGGNPIANAEVRPYVYDAGKWEYAPQFAGETDASGDYDLAVPLGVYRLEFDADGYFGEFYDDVATVDAGTQIRVSDGETVSGNDAVLQKSAALGGTVTLPAGADPEGSDGVVTVVDTATGDEVQTTLDPGEETAPGSNTYPWFVDDLDAGTYRVEFGFEDGAATSEAEFFDNQPESAGAAAADEIVLATGEENTDIDATLRVGGTISGAVVDAEGDPLAGCTVLAVNSINHFVTRTATTDADGSFEVGGLTTGAYGLIVGLAAPSGPCNASEYYANTNGDLAETPAQIIPISTAPGSDVVLGATLVYGGSVAPPPSVTNATAPTIPGGAPTVGMQITANPGTWSPADVNLSYQWRVNGGVIPGATSQSYTPPAEATGLKLSVTVTASKAGYTSKAVTSNETAPVVGVSTSPTVVQNLTLPSVVGVQRVGSLVRADPGSWTPGATTSVQWLRNGEPVPGATGTTYTLGAADAGTYIQVFVTASKAGLTSTSRLSPSTEPVLPGILTVTSASRMVGKLKVGKVLHAVPPSCSPVATGVRYRWMRNGVPIKGRAAKQVQYTLVRADRGKHISVRITLTRPGYDDNVTVATRARKVR